MSSTDKDLESETIETPGVRAAADASASIDDAPATAAATSASSSKKKKKNKAKPAAVAPPQQTSSTVVAPPSLASSSTATPEQAESVVRLLDSLSKTSIAAPDRRLRKTPKVMDDYKFWNTQPVPKLGEEIEENGPIEADKPMNEIRQTPLPLPKDFEWTVLNVDDDKEIKELYTLLTQNYVEDDDAMFRFDYSAEFLKWALKPPGFKRTWHIGVRVSASKKLIAFISGIPADLRMYDRTQQLVEINFLCVHKKLRSKRLAPVLIKEVTRRVHVEGIFQAVYTAGVKLPKPVSTCIYYHRSLNPKKLIETGFSHLKKSLTMAQTIKLYKLPQTPNTAGLREMAEKDVPAVTVLLNQYLSKFDLAPTFSEDEVRHWLLPVPTVVFSYVVENPTSHAITHFASFYSLPSSVINHPQHSHINAAYMFYYAITDSGSASANEKSLKLLMGDMLIMARTNNFDVFNCLTLMENEVFLNELKFGKGDGELQYYLYNYRCRDVVSGKLGLVML